MNHGSYELVAAAQMDRIEGWFSVPEACVLYAAAVDAIGKFPDAQIVEIGSFHGRSTVVLAKAIERDSSTLKVNAIDPHEGNLSGSKRPSSWESFNRNIRERGLDSCVNAIRMPSSEVKWSMPISLLFIDGLHDEASVLLDYERFGKYVQPGGYIAFHDYSNPDYPGVRNVVNRAVASGELSFVRVPSGLDPHDTLALTRKQARLSIVIPTCGRDSLLRALESVVASGASKLDELIVVGDGHQPRARAITEEFSKKFPIRYFEYGPTKMVGAAQRMHAITKAVGTHIAFIDDDDEYASGAITAIRAEATENPNKILVFKEQSRTPRHAWGIVWEKKKVEIGNVGTQGIVVPNVLGKIGVWPNDYCSDYHFLRSTADLYKNKDDDIVWIDKIVAYLY